MTKERLGREKIENKQHKAKYLTGKVPQPKTTEIYPAEKIEKKQHKVNYLTGKIPQPETERYILHREENEKENITPRFIGDNVLTEVMKTTTENCRKKDTKGIDEMPRVPQLVIPTLSCMVCIRRQNNFT